MSRCVLSRMRGLLLSLLLRLLVCHGCLSLLLLLLLMLNLELLIRLRRHIDFITNTIIYLRLGLHCASDDVISEDCFVDNTIEWAWRREVLIISVATFGWIYSNEVSTLLVLLTAFPDKISMSQGNSLPHSFMNGSHVVLRIFCNVFLNHLQQVSTSY